MTLSSCARVEFSSSWIRSGWWLTIGHVILKQKIRYDISTTMVSFHNVYFFDLSCLCYHNVQWVLPSYFKVLYSSRNQVIYLVSQSANDHLYAHFIYRLFCWSELSLLPYGCIHSPGSMSMISVVKLDIVLSLQFNWTLLPQIPYWHLWFPPRTMSCCLGQAVSGGSTDYLTSTYRATVRYWEIQTLAVRCWEMLLPLLYVSEKFCYTWCKQRVT